MKKITLVFSIMFFAVFAVAQFQVGTQSLTVQDPTRGNRNIGYEVCYPATAAGANAPVAAGQFPVIVFGHGFSIAVSEYDVWCNAYAAKGYIIAFPTTEGSAFPFPDHEQFSLDMSFLIDHLLGASTPFPGSILGTSQCDDYGDVGSSRDQCTCFVNRSSTEYHHTYAHTRRYFGLCGDERRCAD